MREFRAIDGILKMAEIIIATREATKEALEHAARVVERQAKKEIGKYQPDTPPFAGWAQLASGTIAEKEKLGYAPPDNPLLRDGDLRNSIGHKVDMNFTLRGGRATVGSDSDIAVYQELGTTRIPPRSFLGSAAVNKTPEVVAILGKGFVAGLVGEEVVGRYLPIR